MKEQYFISKAKPPCEKTSEQLCLRNKLALFPNISLTKWPDWLPVLWCVRRRGFQHQELFTEPSNWRCATGCLLTTALHGDSFSFSSTGVTKKGRKKRKTRIRLVLSRHFWPKSVWWTVASLRRILGINSNIVISFLNSLHNGRI